MRASNDDDSGELNVDFEEDVSLTARLRCLLRTLFHLFYLAAPDLEETSHSQSVRISQAVYFAVSLVKSLQLLSLLYPTDCLHSDWQQFDLWTKGVSEVRVDYLLVTLGMGSFMYYAAAAIVSAPILLYVWLYKTLRRQAERKWRLRVIAFKVLMRIASGALFLPLLCVFLASQRYLQK